MNPQTPAIPDSRIMPLSTTRPQGGTLEDIAKERRLLLWRVILANYHVKPAAKHAIKVRYGL